MASVGGQCAAGIVALLLFASWGTVSHGAGTPATFRVSYNAEVDILAASCKAHFIEGWTFPYTTGGKTWRELGLDGDQHVSNVYVTASPGYNLRYEYQWFNGAWRIEWYTYLTSLSYTLAYDKDNTIRHCGGNATTGAPGTYTARFATGKWAQQMNALSVVFKLAFVPSAKPTLDISVEGISRGASTQYSADGTTVTATLNGPLFLNQDAVFNLTYDYGSSPGPTCSCSSSSTFNTTGALIGGIVAGVVGLLMLVSCGIGCVGLCMSTKTTCACSRCNGRSYFTVRGEVGPPRLQSMYRDVAPSSPPPPLSYYDQAPETGVPYIGVPQPDTKGFAPGSSSGYLYPPPPPDGYTQIPSGSSPIVPEYNPGYSQLAPSSPPVGPPGYPPQPTDPSPPPGYSGAGSGQYPPPLQQPGATGVTLPMQSPGATVCPQCQGKGTEVKRTVPVWAKGFGAMGIVCFICCCCGLVEGYHQEYEVHSSSGVHVHYRWSSGGGHDHYSWSSGGGNGHHGWSSGGGGDSGGGGGGGDGGGGGG